jgi:hypothetical protein
MKMVQATSILTPTETGVTTASGHPRGADPNLSAFLRGRDRLAA